MRRIPQKIVKLAVIALISLAASVSSSAAADEAGYSLSGRLDLRGIQKIESDSITEDPGLEGRIKFDKDFSTLRFHSWLEGGWDGNVRRPIRDHSLFKDYDRVYQS